MSFPSCSPAEYSSKAFLNRPHTLSTWSLLQLVNVTKHPFKSRKTASPCRCTSPLKMFSRPFRQLNRTDSGKDFASSFTLSIVMARSDMRVFALWASLMPLSTKSFKADSGVNFGKVKMNFVPTPSSLSTQIFPSCTSTIPFAMVSPNPVPFSPDPGMRPNC